MLRKTPKPLLLKSAKRIGKILFVGEAALFAVSYAVWYRMNTSRDFRLYLHNNYRWALEGYYSTGEYFSGKSTIRDVDLAVWKSEGKI